MARPDVIRTPDQRLRVFVSSALGELAAERQAVRDAVTRLRLVPVMFELGARPYPARPVYRAYLAQSQVFVGIYWQGYGWVAPGERISGLEDEYRLSAWLPRLIYVKSLAPNREPRLAQLLARVRDEGGVSYQHFSEPAELQQLVENDLAVLLSERFEMTRPGQAAAGDAPLAGALPVPATPLLGREHEAAALEDLFPGPGRAGRGRARRLAETLTAVSAAVSLDHTGERIVIDKLQDNTTSALGHAVAFVPTVFGHPHLVTVHTPGWHPVVQYPIVTSTSDAESTVPMELVRLRIEALAHPGPHAPDPNPRPRRPHDGRTRLHLATLSTRSLPAPRPTPQSRAADHTATRQTRALRTRPVHNRSKRHRPDRSAPTLTAIPGSVSLTPSETQIGASVCVL